MILTCRRTTPGGITFLEANMNVPISPRLKACCGFVSPGERVLDVGTDHGYLGIWLLQQGIASSVIASDIVPGPLSAAKTNASKYGTADKMEFYLSDGLQAVPRDFDTMVCAGMGADTMITILSAAPWMQNAKYRMILQCQSKTPLLRKYLSDNGWRITEETVLRDGRFLYTVMEVYYEPDYPRLDAGEYYFPPALLENPSSYTAAYYRWVVGGLRITTSHQNDYEKQQALDWLTALAQTPELRWLKEETI